MMELSLMERLAIALAAKGCDERQATVWANHYAADPIEHRERIKSLLAPAEEVPS